MNNKTKEYLVDVLNSYKNERNTWMNFHSMIYKLKEEIKQILNIAMVLNPDSLEEKDKTVLIFC